MDPELLQEKLYRVIQTWNMSPFSTRMAFQWLLHAFQSADSESNDLMHVTKWILVQLQGRMRDLNAIDFWQRGCPCIIPNLTTRPFWNAGQFAWVKALEDNYETIKSELVSLRDKTGFQPYRSTTWTGGRKASDAAGTLAHDSGDWNVFYLFLHNVNFLANRKECPKTVAIIQSIGIHYHHAFFSALAPKTHVKKHNGPTNKKLRCHLPLIVPKRKCHLRVGSQRIIIEEGKCILFDDSFEHEAWNDDAEHARIVLIVDVWHPDLTQSERKFLEFVRNSELRAGKKSAHLDEDNFHFIIERNKSSAAANKEAIWA